MAEVVRDTKYMVDELVERQKSSDDHRSGVNNNVNPWQALTVPFRSKLW